MSFAEKLIAWQRRHGRRGLPWQDTRDPYRIWLSEVMLQQTQVSAVIPYFNRFIDKYPTVEALAAASEDRLAPPHLALFVLHRARDVIGRDPQVLRQRLVEMHHPFGHGADGQLGIEGRADLSRHNDVERCAECSRHLVGHHHAAPGQTEDQRPVFLEREETGGELATCVAARLKHHSRSLLTRR